VPRQLSYIAVDFHPSSRTRALNEVTRERSRLSNAGTSLVYTSTPDPLVLFQHHHSASTFTPLLEVPSSVKLLRETCFSRMAQHIESPDATTKAFLITLFPHLSFFWFPLACPSLETRRKHLVPMMLETTAAKLPVGLSVLTWRVIWSFL
jgi:hypothetical protein